MHRTLHLIGLLVLCSVARAQIPETMGTATLPERGPHWVWVDDLAFFNMIDGRSYLVDADSGQMLGMLSTGALFIKLELPRAYDFINSAETYYSRGTRGTRTDVVSIYDARTLEFVGEITIPPKRQAALPLHFLSSLTDDQRFMVVYNFTPAQSVTVVDLKARKLAGEIATPGCALAYPSGARRFSMLCADGAWLDVELAEDGSEARRQRSDPFFDPTRDPIWEKGVRLGNHWLFPSFAGMMYDVDVSGPEPRFAKPWPLMSADERSAQWLPGGIQLTALHERTSTLYMLVHQGGVETRKSGGKEIWVYDLARKQRVRKIDLEQPLVSIEVTQDAAPLLLGSHEAGGAVDVYDIASGRHLRTIEGLGQTPNLLQAVPTGAP
jgi:methylamine dehydrogenase heavy chain